MRGNSTKNADGSRAAGPRLSTDDRQSAERYEKEARAREAALREERNHARRSAHMRTLASERQKAQNSLKNLQAVGRDNQARRK